MDVSVSVAELGLIPAGAGNIVDATSLVRLLWAHPRGCGEHRGRHLCRVSRGSSPRVRGTYENVRQEIMKYGLIPAGAGNIRLRSIISDAAGAHPRGCGEH